MQKFLLAGIVGLLLSTSVQAGIVLPDGSVFGDRQLYGNFFSYSLSYLNNKYGGGFSVPSNDGAIKDGVVAMTGSSGNPVITNSTGIDDAVASASGTTPFFVSTLDVGPEPDNGPSGNMVFDTSKSRDGFGTWDADTSAIRSFLAAGGGQFVPFFNLNETGVDDTLEGTDLLAWARFQLINTTTGATTSFFLSALELGGGQAAAGVLASAAGAPVADPSAGGFSTTDSRWGYAHGNITVSAVDGTFLHFGKVNGDELADFGVAGKTISNNLGADHAAFAIFNADLDALIRDPSSGYDLLRVYSSLSMIVNGYEQSFLLADASLVPEPTSMLTFLVVGLVPLAGWCRRQRSKSAA